MRPILKGIDIDKLSDEDLRKLLKVDIPIDKNIQDCENDPTIIQRAKEAKKLFKIWLKKRNK